MAALSHIEAQENESILAQVEAIGGGYVWEPEIFSVTLFDVCANDAQVAPLSRLRGVEQVALNCRKLSFAAIESVARIAGLRSLVLCQHSLSQEQLLALRAFVPEVLSTEA